MGVVVTNGIPEVTNVTSASKFIIDGVEIHGVSQLICQDNIISRAWEDAQGILHKTDIRHRREVTWGFEAHAKEEFNKLLKIIHNKCDGSSHSTIFTIQTPFMEENSRTMTMYWGSPYKAEAVYGNESGIQVMKHTITFIEPVGTSM